MRLIDADEVYVGMLAQRKSLVPPFDNYAMGYADAIKMVTNAPTVDAIEVVRCKDCIHDNMTTCPLCWIENHTMEFINHNSDDFCSYGERRSE